MSALLTDPYFEADGREQREREEERKKEEQNHHQDINLGLLRASVMGRPKIALRPNGTLNWREWFAYLPLRTGLPRIMDVV